MDESAVCRLNWLYPAREHRPKMARTTARPDAPNLTFGSTNAGRRDEQKGKPEDEQEQREAEPARHGCC